MKTDSVYYCKCGCGDIVAVYRGKPSQFKRGHATKRKRHPVLCNGCNKYFYVKLSRLKAARYCSAKCKNDSMPVWNKGIKGIYHHTKEAKQKITNAQLGRPCPKLVRLKISKSSMGKPGTNTGKQFSQAHKLKIASGHQRALTNPEYRLNLSLALRGRTFTPETREKMSIAKQGDKAPTWRGGISFEPYNSEFNKKLKAAIKNRDSYCCKECGRSIDVLKLPLHIHHINYNKKDASWFNLISLCASCHCKTNTGDRDKWMRHYQEKIQSCYVH